MSQPKFQLETFRGWKWGSNASSDISYYLNSHHIDFHAWSIGRWARPIRVIGMAANGVARSEPFNINTEDTITLLVQWENVKSHNLGLAVYTASWVAPTSDVHTQQRFHYMGHKGEITIDQAHRGYTLAVDDAQFKSPNPFFMKYTPGASGRFAGQSAYGFRSIEAFVQAGTEVNNGTPSATFDREGQLATMANTVLQTAILECGRLSLDSHGKPHLIKYVGDSFNPEELVPEE